MSDETVNDAKLVKIAHGLIAMQVELASGARWWDGPTRYHRARDEFARGYVMGFCDAMFQMSGINDDVRCIALCSLVFMDLFGRVPGAKLAGLALREMGSGDSKRGQTLGGNDFLRWRRANNVSDKAPPPSGLFNHITGKPQPA